MKRMRAAWAAMMFCASLHAAVAAAAEAKPPAAAVSPIARAFVARVVSSRDARGSPFAVVDKREARLYLFDAAGRLSASTPVLIGEAPGDLSADNVGAHAQAGFVPVRERTTPAGRFVAQPGTNNTGEQVVWLDWDSAFAIHRLRPGRSMRERLARLASPEAADKRASWGCVVAPEAFYVGVLQPWLRNRRAVVYVMPEGGDALAMLEPRSD